MINRYKKDCINNILKKIKLKKLDWIKKIYKWDFF